MSGYASLHWLPSAAVENLLWQLDKALIYEYSRISLGIISLICPVMLGFTPGFWAIQSLAPGHLDRGRHGWPLMVWASSYTVLQILIHQCPSTYCRQDRLLFEYLVTVLISRILFWMPVEYLPKSKSLEYICKGSMQAPAQPLYVKWTVWVLSSAMESHCHFFGNSPLP